MSGPSLHADTPSALPAGTRLGEFELLSLLGVGGFGIVYLAFDHALEREVAVKEYMPASLAGRTETMHVSLRSQSDAETFALGLKSFVNEARLLARFDHPSLLKVHRFWEANGTAYMAMPVMRGHTVKEVRAGMQSPPDEAWLRALLEPLLGAIERLHSEGVYHRDIAPDNIQIEPGGHPVLLDFGAARRVISDKSQALTAILKPAYAPIEQYAEAGSVKQGPWTDIYALGATLHYLMLGRPPPPATARAVHDDASALTPQSLPHCSQNFLHIVDWMLAPRPSDRPQNVAALREVLDGRALPPQRRAPEPMASEWDRTVILPPASAPGAAGAVQTPLDDDQATVLIPASTLPTGRVPVQPQAAVSQALPRPPAAPVGPADSVSMRAQPPLPASGQGPGPGPAPAPAPAATAAAALPPAAPAAPVLLAASASGAAPRSRLLPVALGVGAVVVVAAALALWPRSPVVVAVAPAASAAAPVQAPAASAAQAAAATAAPASAVPESTIATVVVPAATATQTGAGPALSTLPHPGATPATTLVTARPARQTAVPRNASAAPAVQPVAPPSEPVAEAAPAPLLPAAPPPAQTEAAKPVALGPEAKCGGRNPLAYFVCMERECLRAEMMPHADCLKWRRAARSE